MAELNFGLLTPPGSQSIGNAFVSGMDQAAVARAQENQNALAQYTLSKARREDELTNQLLGDLRSATTNDEIYRAYQRAGKGDVASKLQSDALTRQKLTGEIAAQPTALAAAQTKLVADKLAESRSMLEGVSTPEEYIAWHEANHADPIIGKALAARGITAEQSRKRIEEALKTPGGLEQLINESKVGVAKFAEMNKPSNVSQTLGGSVRTLAIPGMGGAATVVPGSVGTVTAAPSTEAALMSAQAAARKWNPETLQFENVVPAGMTMRPPVAAGGAPVGAPAATMRLPYTNGSAPATAIPLPYTSGGAPATTIPLAGGAQGNAMAQPSINGMRPSAAPAATGGYSPRMLREMASKGMQPDGKGGQTFIPGGEKDPAVERQVANSRAAGAQTGKSDAIALEKLPNAIATGTELIRKLDALLGDAAVVDGKVLVPAKGIAPANGFENAFGLTGMAARAYPGSAAADFQAKVKEILGGAFLEAYETLRGAQGITDVEGRKATESRTRMSFDLSPAEFINAAREYRKTAAEALGRSETRLKSLKGSSVSSANRPSLDAIFATPEPR
jgi:hypothetical protein